MRSRFGGSGADADERAVGRDLRLGDHLAARDEHDRDRAARELPVGDARPGGPWSRRAPRPRAPPSRSVQPSTRSLALLSPLTSGWAHSPGVGRCRSRFDGMPHARGIAARLAPRERRRSRRRRRDPAGGRPPSGTERRSRSPGRRGRAGGVGRSVPPIPRLASSLAPCRLATERGRGRRRRPTASPTVPSPTVAPRQQKARPARRRRSTRNRPAVSRSRGREVDPHVAHGVARAGSWRSRRRSPSVPMSSASLFGAAASLATVAISPCREPAAVSVRVELVEAVDRHAERHRAPRPRWSPGPDLDLGGREARAADRLERGGGEGGAVEADVGRRRDGHGEVDVVVGEPGAGRGDR